MGTPTYVIKKFGDRYVPVLQGENAPCCDAVSLTWGAVLSVIGVRRGGLLGTLIAGGGVWLMVRGALGGESLRALQTGKQRSAPDTKRAQGASYQNDSAGRAEQRPLDSVDEASMESFPASDPPAYSAADRAEKSS